MELHLERCAVLRASARREDCTQRFASGALRAWTAAEGNDLTSALVVCRAVDALTVEGLRGTQPGVASPTPSSTTDRPVPTDLPRRALHP